jgi:hypothetical protein
MKVREKSRKRTESVFFVGRVVSYLVVCLGAGELGLGCCLEGLCMGWEGEEGRGIMDGSEKERDRRVLVGGGGVRTEDEFLNRCVDVDAVRHFQLVDLELQPLAEGLELGSHFGLRGVRAKKGV